MTHHTRLMLTVYQGTGLIRERRKLTLDKGINIVNFTDVAASIKPETVKFVSLTDPDGTRVLEQNYVYDLVSSEALLRRFIDETITVTAEDGTVYTGKLLNAANQIVLQHEHGQLSVLQSANLRDMQFPSLPDGLITRPTLRWSIFANQAGEHEIELTYLTHNMTWNATYNVLLARGNQHLNLNGWITIENHSGTTYHNSKLKCIGGEISIIPQQQTLSFVRRYANTKFMMRSDDNFENVEQRDLFEYKLYDVPYLTTIRNNEIKQIEFVIAQHVPAKTYFVCSKENSDRFSYRHADEPDLERYLLTEKLRAAVYLQFSTTKDGIDADLPAGDIRVYQEDVDGAALLIGENKIKHTPKGEEVTIYLGKAFDIIGERTPTHFELIGEKVLQESIEIKLRNRKSSEAAEVRVPERLFRWSNWQILNANMDYTQTDAANIEFRLTLPPDGEGIIRYTVQYSW